MLTPQTNQKHPTDVNKSHGSEWTGQCLPLLSERTFHTLVLILCVLVIATGITGMVANSLVIRAYLKIGFSESINISYLALAVSDSGLLLCSASGTLLGILHFTGAPLSVNALELTGPTTYWLGEGFEGTTSCITAYIALERCLCVLFTLHIKRFVSYRKNSVVILAIFVFVFSPSCHGFITYSFEWRFSPSRNRTILRTTPLRSDRRRAPIEKAVKVYLNNLVHQTAILAIWTFTIFLIFALKRNAKSRKDRFGESVSNPGQIRNKRVTKTVIVIATVYLVFSTPRKLINTVSQFYPKFSEDGDYWRIYLVSICVGVLLGLVNSGVNVFIYMKMNLKFKEIVEKMLHLKVARSA